MEKKIYKLFGKVLVTNKPKGSFNKINELAMMSGIFVPEKLCFNWLYLLLQEQQINPNSTFYQSWQDITSKTRFELFLDQIRHYASTYGTDFQGKAWLPEKTGLPEFPFKELKVLEEITEDEVKTEITKLAYSNIAMSSDTLTYIKDIVTGLKVSLDIEQIKNRELKLRMIPMNYQFKNGQECLLWILWKWFNISMLVKNEEVFDSIKAEPSMLPVLVKNKEILASVFFRNKDVFMQFKKCKELCHTVNVIRKLASKLHKPMKKSPWLMLEEMNYSERMKLFNDASIFKLVQMYNVLNNPTGYYVIRNGKAFYRESMIREINNSLLTEIENVIISKIPNVDSVALPKGIELAMPTSEKNFIGDIPLGSYVDCSDKNTMIGIYWKNEWGARDLDLHARTISGESVGWNTSYYNNGEDVIFSGDMTNADPEASEVMWFKKRPTNAIVSVLEYNGDSDYSYDMFIAQEKATNFEKNYMVDPRHIIYKARMNFKGATDVTLGYFRDGRFVFHSCNVGNGRIPNDWRTKILNHLTQCSYLTIREVLQLAGIPEDPNSDIKIESKGDLINFFTS